MSFLQIRMRLRWWSLKRPVIIWMEVKSSRWGVLVVPGHPNPNSETALGNFCALRCWDEAEVGKKERSKGVSSEVQTPRGDLRDPVCATEGLE